MRTTAILATTAALLVPAAANADHEYGSDIAIRALAADVEYFAAQVYREGSYLAGHRDRGDYRALQDLSELDRAARHFNRQVQRYYPNPLHAAGDLEHLRVAFYRAHDSAPHLYGYRRLENDFYALADAMRRLEYAFADVGYRYRRPFPRLRFSINLAIPYHHPRGHRVYRKPYGHGYRWYSSVDLYHYSKPRHGKRYYDRGKGHYTKRGKDHYQKRGKGHYKGRGRGHDNDRHERKRYSSHRRGKHYEDRDDDHDRDGRRQGRRRGSARDTRSRR